MQTLLLLSSLPESWETLVVSFSNSTRNEQLIISMVKDAIFNEKVCKREMGTIDRSELQALVLKGSREKGRDKGRGHQRGTGRGQPRSHREVALLLAFIEIRRDISRGIVQGIMHIISLQK